MKLLGVIAALLVGACTTTGTLSASQGFGYAQLGFKSLQQASLACIETHVAVCEKNRGAIIAAVDRGQAIETAGYEAQRVHDQPALLQAASDLGAVVTALQGLGVKP